MLSLVWCVGTVSQECLIPVLIIGVRGKKIVSISLTPGCHLVTSCPPFPPSYTHTAPLSVCFFSNHAQLAVFWVAEPSLPLRFFTTSGKVSVDGREAALWGRNVAMSLCVSVSLRTMSLLSTLRTLESLGFQPSRSCSLKVTSHHWMITSHACVLRAWYCCLSVVMM